MEQIFHDAGLPDDAYINIFATNSQIADMVADPRVAGVSVTGSERAGAAVAEVAGRNLKKVVLELGGSDPFIVLDSDDMAKTVKAAVAGRMGNAGQACNAAKRIIVVGDLYDEFAEPVHRGDGRAASGRSHRPRLGPRAAVLGGGRRAPDGPDPATRWTRAPRCAPAASGSTGRARSSSRPS